MTNYTNSTREKPVTKDAAPTPPLPLPVSEPTPLPSYAFCQSLYTNEHICNLGKYRGKHTIGMVPLCLFPLTY